MEAIFKKKKAEVLNIGLCHNYRDGANFYVLISLFNQACTNKCSEVNTGILSEVLSIFKLTEWKII